MAEGVNSQLQLVLYCDVDVFDALISVEAWVGKK